MIETSRAYGRGLLRGVSRFHAERGTWSIYFKPHDLGKALPAWLKSWNGTGILARITSQKMGSALQATGLPLIDLRGAGRTLGIPPFGPDSITIAEMAYEHLRSLGIVNFAFCGEPRGRHLYDDRREDYFRNFVEADGFSCNVFQHRYHGQTAKSWEKEQEQLAGWLNKLPKPVGVMACHDNNGQQVLDACKRGDLHVPDEVAVVGVDNGEFLCNLSIPSLSSIDVNSERIGYEAAQLLDSNDGWENLL
ncbi:MAG: XylR family transcriptional regulator [Pirellulales bacterium]